MAIIKITKAGKTKASLKAVLNYISDPQKTTLNENKKLLSSLNCWGSIKNIYEIMIATKEMYRKAADNKHSEMYKHFQQSFRPNEVMPQTAHQIGVKWADTNFGKHGFEVCICTHIDKEHVHNHFIINSVNALTGKTIVINANRTLEQLKKSSDDLCREYGLSVIDRSYYAADDRQSSYNMKKKYSVEREDFRHSSWQKYFYDTIKEAIEKAAGKGFEFFCHCLAEKQIKVEYERLNNDIIFRHESNGYTISDRTLEKTFPSQNYFLRSNIEKTVGSIPVYEIEPTQILSEKKQGFYKLIENLFKVIDSAGEIATKQAFYDFMEENGWLIKDTPTGRAFYHEATGRILYDNTIYKIAKKHEYCLAYLEQHLK